MTHIKKETIDNAIRSLLQLGLGEYQAKAYSGLLVLSEASAPDLVGLIEVPKARIYQILDELLEMGLIRKKPGRPVKYIILPPKQGLENMVECKKEKNETELDQLKVLKENVIDDLQDLSHINTKIEFKKKGFLEIISAGEISEVETKKAFRAAIKEILILTGVFEYLPRVTSELEKALKRGVKVKILFQNPEKLGQTSADVQKEIITALNGKKNLKYRFCNSMPLRGTIVDSRKAIFSVDEKKIVPFQKEIGITENENMALALSIYFNSMWDLSKQ